MTRLELPGWNGAGYDDSSWYSATVADDAFKGRFEAQIAPPIRCVLNHRAHICWEKKSVTSYLVDFGQSFPGVRIRVRGSAGSTVTLNHPSSDAQGHLHRKPPQHASAGSATPPVTGENSTSRGSLSTGSDMLRYHALSRFQSSIWPDAQSAHPWTAQERLSARTH